jgi:ABC-2 type transport system permease protein
MISITVILKKLKPMNNTSANSQSIERPARDGSSRLSGYPFFMKWFKTGERVIHPFRVIMEKEMSDHIRSWRFIILLSLIALTCLASVYTGLAGIGAKVKSADSGDPYFFLLLFTSSDGTLPPFFVFVSFLGPLLGISLGFDAINSEQTHGTLSRVLAQPIHRDYIINAKFLAALNIISIMFLSLGFLVMGAGLILTGIPPTPEEFLRVICFVLLSILYVSFWLNLSILFSVRFRQPATSALAGIAVWLFFTVFYSIIVSLIARAASPSAAASAQQVAGYQEMILNLLRILPSQLYSDATTTLLVPTVRSLGPLTMEQIVGAIPGPLPLGQSLLLAWPQITGLIASTILCFVFSYISFMKKEIRSR